MQAWVLVEGAINVVRALEGVEVAGTQRFFAARPTHEVFRLGGRQGFLRFALRQFRIILFFCGKSGAENPKLIVPNSPSESPARYDALESTRDRSSWNLGSRSFTTIIPRDEGPKASASRSKETEPGDESHVISSASRVVTRHVTIHMFRSIHRQQALEGSL